MPRSLPILFLLSLSATPAFAASLQLCPGTPVVSPGALTAAYTTPNGLLVHAIVTEEPGKPESTCRVLPLPAAVGGIDAIHFLPHDAAPGKTILLQGLEADKGKSFSISEHTLVADGPTPNAPVPMPFDASLLAAMQARAFGADRAQADIKDGRLYLTCRAGTAPAGVALLGPWYLPQAQAQMHAAFSGEGRFAVTALDAERAAQDKPLTLGHLDPRAQVSTARLALPDGLNRTAWRQFTIACPEGAARLQLDALTLTPAATSAVPRATWTWSPDEWRERGAALLDWAVERKIGHVFINVPVAGQAVVQPAVLAAFVRQAAGRGVAVSAALGRAQMVLEEERDGALHAARAFASYNTSVEPAARLAGVQFDVRPHLLPPHVLAQDERDTQLLALAAALRDAAGTLTLEFVAPSAWHARPALMRGLARHADATTVVNFHTDPLQIYRVAVPFLDWGTANGKTVRIALEAGPIGAETQRRYERVAPGGKGELLVFEIDGYRVLLLLRVQAAHDGAQAYAMKGSRAVDGTARTFHADKAALMQLLPRLERVFGAWPGFGGIALHELR